MTTLDPRIDEINDTVLLQLTKYGIEVTEETRLTFLLGMQAANRRVGITSVPYTDALLKSAPTTHELIHRITMNLVHGYTHLM